MGTFTIHDKLIVTSINPSADEFPIWQGSSQKKATASQIVAAVSTTANMSTVGEIVAATVPSTILAIRTAGYTTAGDGGGALYRRVVSMPSHAGRVQSTDGAWWEVTFDGPVNVLSFGADRTGVTSATTAVQNAVNYANTLITPKAVYAPNGEYLLNTTVTLATMATLIGDGAEDTIFIPGMVDGTAAIKVVSSTIFLELRDFSIKTNLNSATFITGTAAPNCIGLQANDVSVGHTTRFKIDNLHIYGCGTGAAISGWIGRISKLHIDYCELGFAGDQLNSVSANLHIENCRKGSAWTGPTYGLVLDGFIEEGGIANSVTSTMDDHHCVVFSAPYWEWTATYPRTQPYMTIGATTLCSAIEMKAISISGSSGMAAGVYPLALDKVTYGEITGEIIEGSQLRCVSTTANTINMTISTSAQSGGGTQDGSLTQDAVLNYFPNPEFDVWLRGWTRVDVLRATLAKETTILRRGVNAIRITGVAAQNNNSVTFVLRAPITTALRGKTVRAGVWVWVPNLAAFNEASRTMYPDLNIYSSNGTTTVSSSSVNTRFAMNAWNYMTMTVAVQTDCTEVGVAVYMNSSANNSTGAEYIVLDSLTLVDNRCPISWQMQGRYAGAPSLPYFFGNKVVLSAAATPTDANQVFEVGDQVWTTSPAGSTSPGWVCTTAGTGGTAVWKTMAALGA